MPYFGKIFVANMGGGGGQNYIQSRIAQFELADRIARFETYLKSEQIVEP